VDLVYLDPPFMLPPLVRLCYSLCETHRHSALKVAQTKTCCCCRQPRSGLPSWKAPCL
jgi:16S rRNA G966 N2-methylase RsmD